MAYYVDKAKHLVISKPPLVLFLLGLLFTGILFFTVALYIRYNEIHDPDSKVDWNTFLDKFTDLEFCTLRSSSNVDANDVPLSEGSHVSSTFSPSTQRQLLFNNQKGASVSTSGENVPFYTKPFLAAASDYRYLRNQSVSMFLTVIPNEKLLQSLAASSSSQNVTHVTGILTGDQLGLTDDAALKDEVMKIQFTLPFNLFTLRSPQCSTWPTCSPHVIAVCLTLQATSNLFPLTNRMPKSCDAFNESLPVSHQQLHHVTVPPPSALPSAPAAGRSHDTSSIVWVDMIGRVRERHLPQLSSQDWCQNGSQVRVRHLTDEQLTVMLSLEERSLINLHLMHTSYFIFVMVITVIVFSILRHKVKYKVLTAALPTQAVSSKS